MPRIDATLADLLRAFVHENVLNRVFTRQDFIATAVFLTGFSRNYINAFLSNSEIDSTHSPTYEKCVVRVAPGVYALAS